MIRAGRSIALTFIESCGWFMRKLRELLSTDLPWHHNPQDRLEFISQTKDKNEFAGVGRALWKGRPPIKPQPHLASWLRLPLLDFLLLLRVFLSQLLRLLLVPLLYPLLLGRAGLMLCQALMLLVLFALETLALLFLPRA
jgi:hypothetical protein